MGKHSVKEALLAFDPRLSSFSDTKSRMFARALASPNRSLTHQRQEAKTDEHGYTPLYGAACIGAHSIISFLVENRAKLGANPLEASGVWCRIILKLEDVVVRTEQEAIQ